MVAPPVPLTVNGLFAVPLPDIVPSWPDVRDAGRALESAAGLESCGATAPGTGTARTRTTRRRRAERDAEFFFVVMGCLQSARR